MHRETSLQQDSGHGTLDAPLAEELKTETTIPGSQGSEPQPQRTIPPTVEGSLTFFCCGGIHKISGRVIQVVKCPICQTSFSLSLLERPLGSERYSRGQQLRILENITVRVSPTEFNLKKGEIVEAGEDIYGVLGTLEGEVLIALQGAKGVLYGSVPLNKVEPIRGST